MTALISVSGNNAALEISRLIYKKSKSVKKNGRYGFYIDPQKQKINKSIIVLREHISFYNIDLNANIKKERAVLINMIFFLHREKALFPKQWS